jgi:hypothetical protein
MTILARIVLQRMLVLCVLVSGVQAMDQALTGWSVVESEHFRIHFPPEPQVTPATFSRQLEESYTQLQSTFRVTLPDKIQFYVWNRGADAEAVLGRPAGFANPRKLLIHATSDQTPGHELTHVLVHLAVGPEITTRFISEGTAVAFDLTRRDRLLVARTALHGQQPAVEQWWTTGRATPDSLFYPVAGAFVDRLLSRGGHDRFFRLLKRQTIEHAREVYGPDLDRLIAEFEADLANRPESTASASNSRVLPTLEALRAGAQARMRQDLEVFTHEQVREIESTYQSASSSAELTPDARQRLLALSEKYPKANRTGCALLYLAQASAGEAREVLLKRVIADHGDAWYGDGTQVGAYARVWLAAHYVNTDRRALAMEVAAEVERLFPGAIDHTGLRLSEHLKKLQLLP